MVTHYSNVNPGKFRPRIAALVGCAVLAVSGGCQSGAKRPGVINHTVFFTLQDESQADALIADCDFRLASIPGVKSYYCGKHVDTGRSNIDTDYTVGFYVGFNTFEDYARYVKHDQHQAFLDKWQSQLADVEIRDVYDITR